MGITRSVFKDKGYEVPYLGMALGFRLELQKLSLSRSKQPIGATENSLNIPSSFPVGKGFVWTGLCSPQSWEIPIAPDPCKVQALPFARAFALQMGTPCLRGGTQESFPSLRSIDFSTNIPLATRSNGIFDRPELQTTALIILWAELKRFALVLTGNGAIFSFLRETLL